MSGLWCYLDYLIDLKHLWDWWQGYYVLTYADSWSSILMALSVKANKSIFFIWFRFWRFFIKIYMSNMSIWRTVPGCQLSVDSKIYHQYHIRLVTYTILTIWHQPISWAILPIWMTWTKLTPAIAESDNMDDMNEINTCHCRKWY